MSQRYQPVVLVIIDGWGISTNQRSVLNTTELPTIKKMNQFYPMIALQASGISVGLPWGEAGNSEVGHITIGAGKIIYQNLPRITLSIQDRSFFSNDILLSAINGLKENGKALHLIGLVSDGVVHASREHLFALLELAQAENFSNVFVHAFTDGRDSEPTSGAHALEDLRSKCQLFGRGQIATVIGRHWAMDRNNNWDRTEKAFKCLTTGEGNHYSDPVEYLQQSYQSNITDEYVEPGTLIVDNLPVGRIKDGDAVIFFNFREDRARQLTKAFSLPGFNKFSKTSDPKVNFVTMVEYEKDLPVSVAYPPEDVKNGIGEIVSSNNLRQLRIAETEKYAHVTYFFNGGKEEVWKGEERILIPSKAVARFDESPEMSAREITDKLITAIEQDNFNFILVNYANADMVAHTGNEEACRIATQIIDKQLEILIPTILNANGCLLVTADHGNVEVTKDYQTGRINTEHDPSPVPLWYINPDNHIDKTQEQTIREQTEVRGLLSDVAPTILSLLGIPKPPEMHGEDLLAILTK